MKLDSRARETSQRSFAKWSVSHSYSHRYLDIVGQSRTLEPWVAPQMERADEKKRRAARMGARLRTKFSPLGPTSKSIVADRGC